MRAICHKCGVTKNAPQHPCGSCKATPKGDDELALAFMLSDRFLSEEKLVRASQLIKGGQRIQIPAHIKTAVLAGIQAARAQKPRRTRERTIPHLGLTALFGLILALFGLFHPWPHYKWSCLHDTVSSYESFLNRFPTSHYTPFADAKIRLLREPEAWREAVAVNTIAAFRSYVWGYPNGKHLNEANQRMLELADAEWENISGTRSEAQLRDFIATYPAARKVAKAEARIQELYNDLDWVKEQDSLSHYERFVARFPNHPNAKWIEKRIIDLEVNRIAAGEYGELPRAQPISNGGDVVAVDVENETGYDLTVRYSGAESKKLIIPIGTKQSVALQAGSYRVAASVGASRIRNYYGVDTLKGGRYQSRFYVQSQTAPTSLPTYRYKRLGK